MDLLREVQQYLADEADVQRFRWEGNEYMDPNDIKLREPWRAFGPLPAEEVGANGVKIGGFQGDIPLEHQAEWDTYLKTNPEAFSGKAQASRHFDASSILVMGDSVNGDANLIGGGREHMVLRHEDIPEFIAFLQTLHATAVVSQTAPTPHVVNGPPVRPAPAP